MTTLDVKPLETDSAAAAAAPWKMATVVLAVVAVALVAALMAVTGVFAGQSDVEAISAEYHAAWADLDADAVASFFPENGGIYFAANGPEYVGHQEIQAYAASYLTGSVIETGQIVSDGPYVIVPFVWDWPVGLNTVGVSVLRINGDQVLSHYIFVR